MRQMKDSGIPWIGEIPSDWALSKIKYSSYVKGRIGWQGLKSDEFIDNDTGAFLVTGTDFIDGKVNWDTCYHIGDNRYNEAPDIQLKNNDLLITKDGTIGKIALVLDMPDKAILNSGIFVTRPLGNEYIQWYLYWVLSSPVFERYCSYLGMGSTINHLYQASFEKFVYPLPDIATQKKIINYLNLYCSQIDTAISKEQQIIEKLKEYKKSKITEAVTKGLDSSVPMKDSGLEWVGLVPKHWNIVRLKTLFHIVDVRNESDESATLLSLFTSIGVRPRSEMEDKGNKAMTVIGYKIVQHGDLIVNKLLAWMGAIGYSEYDGVTSPDYDVYRAFQDANVVEDYYQHYFRDTKFKDDCYKYGHGIMMMRWRTYPDEFKSIPVVNPPLEEQQRIAKYIVDISNKIDTTISRREQLIFKLTEYKKSLIYEAVTGKMEV